MAEANQQQVFDRLAPISSPERVVEIQNGTDEAPIPKDERVVLVNPPSVVTVSSTPTNVKDLTVVSDSSGSLLPTTYPYNAYTPQDPGFYYGGYDNGITWDDQTSYMNASNLHIVPPPMYNDASSMFYSGHGYDGSMGYGQYSPIPSPISPIMIDGQLYSTHQIPVSPSYYPPVSPGLPHVSSSLSGTQTELMASGSSSQENLVDLFSPGSGFYIPFGSFSSAELSGNTGLGYYKYPAEFGASEAMTTNQSNALDAGRYMNQMTPYPQAMGMYGAYDQNVTQGAYQGMGYGSNSMARRDAYNYPSSGSASRWQTGQRNRLVPERNMGRRERDRELFNSSPDMTGMINDRNRGPRAARMMKVRSIGDESEDVENRFDLDMYNRADFVTDLEDAKFFVIKSFSEDNVHKSIKYNVWASTPLGNRKLDAAFTEATEKGNCPVYLLFSVNASGQFCGVAEMVGNVDFEKDAEYWQLDRWSGQFPVKWLFVKDVPNSRFRHIILENNDNKPVTHSRDSQEVSLEQGLEMLKIFKSHEMDTSLFDDFIFYDEREKLLLERKAKQRALAAAANAADANVSSPVVVPPVAAPVAESINKLSDNLADTLNLDGGGVGGAAAKKAAVKPEL